MRKKIGLICMIAGTALILAAAGLLLFNRTEASRAARASEDIMPKLAEMIPEQLPSQQPFQTPTQPPLGQPDVTPGSVQEDMPVVEIDGYGYIGYLSIPALELELPVMDKWDYGRLKKAPCRYYGSVSTGDFVIAGHNFARHFGGLSKLNIGDTVQFIAMDGAVYTYQVGDIETLLPSATEEMIAGEWDLSLYTCTPGGAKRVTIRCDRVDSGGMD